MSPNPAIAAAALPLLAFASRKWSRFMEQGPSPFRITGATNPASQETDKNASGPSIRNGTDSHETTRIGAEQSIHRRFDSWIKQFQHWLNQNGVEGDEDIQIEADGYSNIQIVGGSSGDQSLKQYFASHSEAQTELNDIVRSLNADQQLPFASSANAGMTDRRRSRLEITISRDRSSWRWLQ